MNLAKKWCGKKSSVSHLRAFKCIAWEHISNSYRKKLDAKWHACIMMGYFEESKVYQLFDLVKKKIIISIKVIFYEKYSWIKLSNSSFGLIHSNRYDIVSSIIFIIPLLGISISSSTSLPKLTSRWSTLIETITSHDQPFERNESTLTLYLPRWDVKTLEFAGSYVGDISSGHQNRS